MLGIVCKTYSTKIIKNCVVKVKTTAPISSLFLSRSQVKSACNFVIDTLKTWQLMGYPVQVCRCWRTYIPHNYFNCLLLCSRANAYCHYRRMGTMKNIFNWDHLEDKNFFGLWLMLTMMISMMSILYSRDKMRATINFLGLRTTTYKTMKCIFSCTYIITLTSAWARCMTCPQEKSKKR